jgi:hypothetical protein
MIRVIVIASLILLITIFLAGASSHTFRHPSIEDIQEQYYIQASKKIIEALKLNAFAAQLDCPCYDVVVSTQPEVFIIEVNKDRCPDTKGDKNGTTKP